jgi:hypothetical protein
MFRLTPPDMAQSDMAQSDMAQSDMAQSEKAEEISGDPRLVWLDWWGSRGPGTENGQE